MPRPGRLNRPQASQHHEDHGRFRWSKTWRVPTSGAIGRARLRLGAQPVKVLFA
ncbi:transposase domain-containing protein, partial [Streptomyces sp. NPDC058240]|uniref:transposase domain-containing protein n=1 Tax=Streptomyces sp. NPDC058240 TaxID=3346396 RepID=UPI0036E94EA3